MKTAIIVSKKDTAGMNIKERLLELFSFRKENNYFYYPKKAQNLEALGRGCNAFWDPKNPPVTEKRPVKLSNLVQSRALSADFYDNENIKLCEMEKESIFCEDIDKEIDADLFMFATKHQSKSGIPSLSVHSPGNWGIAEAGGRGRELCVAPASLLKFSLQTIERFAREQFGEKILFDIVQECTHHGPYLEKPCMFIEIGSTEKEWAMRDAAAVIAKTIMHVLTNPLPKYNVAFGIGGIHTAIAFKRVVDTTDYTFGHICPKYMLEQLDERMIKQAMERNTEKCETVMVDWKGMSEEKDRIIKLLNDLKIEWKKSRDAYPH